VNLKLSIGLAVCTGATVAALGAADRAQAQGSTLRIACTGPNAGAEMSVNGEFKGECPLDIRVSAGTVNIRGVKSIDAAREQVFEQSFRLGADVVKQVNVQLSRPRAKTAQRQQGDAPATVQAAATPAAPAAPAPAQGLPARPQLPFAVPESAWAALEASEAYRNLPVPRSIQIAYQGSMLTEFTGSKSSSLPKQAPVEIREAAEIIPISEKCTVTRKSLTVSGTPPGGDSFLYLCGWINLGMVLGGKTFSRLERVEELSGSLFPLRVGNQQTVRLMLASDQGSQFDTRQQTSCKVTGQGQARELDPRLTGAAWQIRCEWNTQTSTGSYPGEMDDFYLEDLGAMMSNVGRVDATIKAAILPGPGSQTVLVAGGEYGSRITTTFANYTWSAGSPYVAGAPVPSPFTGSTGQGASAQRAVAQAPAPAPAPARAREESSSSGPGFGAGLLGGLVSRLVDRNVAQVNSALAGTGAVGSVAANLNSRLAEETKAGIARDMMSTDEARLGGAVAGALTSGVGAPTQTASVGGGATGGASSSSSTTALTKEMGAACQAEYRGPDKDPQVDSFCKLAAFNTCLDRKTGTTTYRSQTRSVCNQLDQTLRALKSGRAATYCPLYCGS
jgi:hypothetical protein